MRMMVNWNGTLMPLEEARIPVFDHGYLYGDGVFEGIRIYNRRIFKLDEHLQRFFHGLRMLSIHAPMSYEELQGRIVDTVEAANAENGYIRLSATRGTGIGLDPKNIDQTPNLMIAVTRLALYPPELYERGLDVVTVSTRVFTPDSLDPRIKSIGRYVSNIQAKLEANRQGAGEGLMLNAQGYVAEATGDNLFLVKDGALLTPPPAAGILEGITRNTVMELGRELGFEVHEYWMTRFDIFSADEAFLTGTAAEVIPMVQLDGQPIGDGKPGPVTRCIIQAFRELTTQSGLPVVSGAR